MELPRHKDTEATRIAERGWKIAQTCSVILYLLSAILACTIPARAQNLNNPCIESSVDSCSVVPGMTFVPATNPPLVIVVGQPFSLCAVLTNLPGEVVTDTIHLDCSLTQSSHVTNSSVVTNWWTNRVGSFSASGAGLCAAFTPTNTGTGTLIFYTTYVNPVPCGDPAQFFTITNIFDLTVIKADQTITFNPLSDKTYGDAPFTVNATASSGLPVSFSIVSGLATISGNTVTITGAGAVTVRATQSGNVNYNAAPNVERTFTVSKAVLTVTADNKTRSYGTANPVLTLTYSGFVGAGRNEENASVIDSLPEVSTTALPNSPAGTYPITLSGGTDDNYALLLIDGVLTVENLVDIDQDGLSDSQESEIYGTNPLNPDTDDDGASDGWEAAHGTDSNSASDGGGGGVPPSPWAIDSDGDGRTLGQEVADGTDPNDENSAVPVRLGYWRFNQESLPKEEGQWELLPWWVADAPVLSDWSGDAVSINSSTSKLKYHNTENNSATRAKGTIRFWFKPAWDQGSPPTIGRLIQMGNPLSHGGWWALSITGNQLQFETKEEGVVTTYLTHSISDWTSAVWHQIVLVYARDTAVSSGHVLLYIDGVLAAQSNTGPSQYFRYRDPFTLPGRFVASMGGFNIGCNNLGGEQANGQFDELETFNYELSPTTIATEYNAHLTASGLPTVNFGPAYIQTTSLQPTITSLPSANMAVLVKTAPDDFDFSAAAWGPFDANPSISLNVAPLGSADGTRYVWIGVKGINDENPYWRGTRIVVDTRPPDVVITPADGTVTTPILQIVGVSSPPVVEPIDRVEYDLVNDNGSFLNQKGYVLSQIYDATAGVESDRTTFQCFDVRLASGDNTVTMRVFDRAGNMTTVQRLYTLNLAGDATAPVLSITWPPNNSEISGDTFLLEGTVDDGAHEVTITGLTAQPISVAVNRAGSFLAENLPLAAGVNTLTVTAKDALDRPTSQTLTLTRGNALFTVDAIPPTALAAATMTVSGQITESDYVIWVNGIEAAMNADGIHWDAANVPVTSHSYATVHIAAVPMAGSAKANAASATGGGTVHGALGVVGPPWVRVASYMEKADISVCGDTYNWQRDWTYTGGGSGSEHQPPANGNPACNGNLQWDPEALLLAGASPAHTLNNPCGRLSANLPWEFRDTATSRSVICPCVGCPPDLTGGSKSGTTSSFSGPSSTESFTWGAATQIDLLTDGPPTAPAMRTYLVKAKMTAEEVALPPKNFKIRGQTLLPNVNDPDWGEIILQLPKDDVFDVTPKAISAIDAYTFEVEAEEIILQLTPDANRDGKITVDDKKDETTVHKPFRFWINDDTDDGDLASGDSDIPGATPSVFSPDPNYHNAQVDGRCDLIDFFPVFLNFRKVLEQLPPLLAPMTEGYRYKLSQADEAVNFVYTDLTRDQAFDYLTSPDAPVYGYSLGVAHAASTTKITASGVILTDDFLNRVLSGTDKGVLLIEGRVATTKPLVLEIWRNGKKLATNALHLSISGVEEMYRWVNLRRAFSISGETQPNIDRATDVSQPPNFPDAESNLKQVVFLHGYNVAEDKSRGFISDFFKRLWQSGSKAMYTGVSWYGNQGQFLGIGPSADLNINIRNAFLTAPYLRDAVANLPGTHKYIAGHSLANMVIPSAIADHGMSVNAYFAINAAVPIEAFDPSLAVEEQAMVSPYRIPRPPGSGPWYQWDQYDRRLRASDWHLLFPVGDGRRELTWKNRFGVIPNLYNFYSSGEDVLENADTIDPPGTLPPLPLPGNPTPSRWAWVSNEMRKGTDAIALLTVKDQAGWALNNYWFDSSQAPLSPTAASSLVNPTVNPLLREEPFFNEFRVSGLFDPVNGSTLAQNPEVRAEVLGSGIPALSYAVARNAVDVFHPPSGVDRNIDMMTLQTGWPADRLADLDYARVRWFHSDLREVAYPFNHRLHDKIVELGGLK